MKDDLFLKKMKGVKPIDKSDILKKKIPISKEPNTKTKAIDKKKDQYIGPKEQTVKSENYKISFSEINKDLKKGRIKIDRRLDLHGYNLIDAEEKFKAEVVKLYNKNKRCILIITGKGTHINKNKSANQNEPKPKLYYGKIKNSILSWIKDGGLKNYILTYQDASAEYGGDGAIFVYLRKNKN